jgi:hypothetical protein
MQGMLMCATVCDVSHVARSVPVDEIAPSEWESAPRA